MKSTRFLISILLVISSFLSLQAQDIIPKPKEYKANGEVFQITSEMEILYSGELKAMADFLGENYYLYCIQITSFSRSTTTVGVNS